MQNDILKAVNVFELFSNLGTTLIKRLRFHIFIREKYKKK